MNPVYLFLFLLLLRSTTDISAQNKYKTAPLTDLSQLEGHYNVIAVHDTVYASLEWIAMMEPRLDSRYFRDKKCHITVQKTRSNRLSFSLWEGDKKLASSYMKGRLKDGKVQVRRTKVRLFTVILNTISIHHAEMALAENGDLVVSDANLGGCGLIVFFPIACASDQPHTLVFERIR